jgi:hypothetical protein
MKKLLVSGCLFLVPFPLLKGVRGMWFSYILLVDRYWYGIHYPKPYSHYTPISLIPQRLTSKI